MGIIVPMNPPRMSHEQLVELYEQAAMSASAGAKQGVVACMVDACKWLYPEYMFAHAYVGREFMLSVFGKEPFFGFQYSGGYSGQQWLSKTEKSALVLWFLFAAEYVKNEMVETSISLDQSVVHPQSSDV